MQRAEGTARVPSLASWTYPPILYLCSTLPADGTTRDLMGHCVRKRCLALALLLAMSLTLMACSGKPTLMGDAGRMSATPTAKYRLAEVRTSTPPPTEAPPTVPKPTATFVPLITPSPTAAGDRPTEVDVPRIGVAAAKGQADNGMAVFVDVRTQATYAQAHIAGALSMPANQVAKRYAELPDDKLIVFYCA